MGKKERKSDKNLCHVYRKACTERGGRVAKTLRFKVNLPVLDSMLHAAYPSTRADRATHLPAVFFFGSFAVDQLLAAYLIFAVLFLVAATGIVLFLALDHLIDLGVGWLLSEVRGAFSMIRHLVIVPARAPASGKRSSL